jgi:hypothetical protein
LFIKAHSAAFPTGEYHSCPEFITHLFSLLVQHLPLTRQFLL